jgi:hypothetical protein
MNPLRRFVVVVVVMTLLAPALALAQQTAPKAEQKAPEAQVEKKAEPKAEQKAEAKPEHKAGKAEHKAEKKQDPANKGRVPVVVDYEGEDALGQRLAFELREAFRASAGFRLTGTGDKGLRRAVAGCTRVQGPARAGFNLRRVLALLRGRQRALLFFGFRAWRDRRRFTQAGGPVPHRPHRRTFRPLRLSPLGVRRQMSLMAFNSGTRRFLISALATKASA